jgi:hypothetical protein
MMQLMNAPAPDSSHERANRDLRPAQPRATAVAVRDGRILAVGEEAAVRQALAPVRPRSTSAAARQFPASSTRQPWRTAETFAVDAAHDQ